MYRLDEPIRPLPPPVRQRRVNFPMKPVETVDPAMVMAMMRQARARYPDGSWATDRENLPINEPSFDPSMLALPPPAMAGAPVPETAPQPILAPAMVLPAPPSRLSDLRASRTARLSEPSTPNSRLASGGSMLARGLQAGAGGGSLASALGGGLGGLIAGLISPKSDERWRRQEDVGRIDEEIGREVGVQKAEADIAKDRATAEYTSLRPELERTRQDVIRARDEGKRLGTAESNDIRRMVANNNAIYQRERIELGRDTADNLRDYRDQIVDLKAQGLDQGDERIRQLERRIDETIRHNTTSEGIAARNAASGETRAGASVVSANASARRAENLPPPGGDKRIQKLEDELSKVTAEAKGIESIPVKERSFGDTARYNELLNLNRDLVKRIEGIKGQAAPSRAGRTDPLGLF